MKTLFRTDYVKSFFALFLILVSAGSFANLSFAQTSIQPFTNKEKIYLKEITPVLYELSELGQSVTENAVGLQAATPDKCSYEFGYYQGIVESLRTRLNAVVPPPRFASVQSLALEAISDYSDGLRFYASSCTVSDSEVRASMSEKAYQKLVTADTKIREVNGMIASPGATSSTGSKTQVQSSSNNKIQRMCTNSWPSDQRMQEYCVKNQTAALNKLSEMTQMYEPGTRERKIMQGCSNVWKKGDTYDYRMILYCVENQLGN